MAYQPKFARKNHRVSPFFVLLGVIVVPISLALTAVLLGKMAQSLSRPKATAQAALHSGANDMGSIMIEENVVSSAGAHNSFDAEGIQSAIREAGFIPRLRDQLYRMRKYAPQTGELATSLQDA